MLEALRKATLDDANICLSVKCGDKEVSLKAPRPNEDIMHLEVTIKCEEASCQEDMRMDVNASDTETGAMTKDQSDLAPPIRKSDRNITRVPQPTQGIVNRNHTCFGISILHTFAYLMQLYPVLKENSMLSRLSLMKLDGTDQIEDRISEATTNDILRTMNGGQVEAVIRSEDQDCGEFLVKFAEQCNIVHEYCCFGISVASRRECAEGHHPPELESSDIELAIFLQVNGCISEKRHEYTIQGLIDSYCTESLSDLTPEKKRCEECVTRNEPDPSRGEGLCPHTHKPCSECGKQLNRRRSVRRFETFPCILVIEIMRTRFKAYVKFNKTTKVHTPVRVNSIVTLQLCDEFVPEYQIVGIICHEGISANSGHYVSYIRCKGEWRLFDDSRVKLIPDIVDEVNCKAVYMWFYAPITMLPAEERLEAMLIGTNRRRQTFEDEIELRSKRAKK